MAIAQSQTFAISAWIGPMVKQDFTVTKLAILT